MLHVPSAELPPVLDRVWRSLRPGGALHMSFKEGAFEGIRDGRYYTDMTAEALRELAGSAGFRIADVRTVLEQGRSIGWVEAICLKAPRNNQ